MTRTPRFFPSNLVLPVLLLLLSTPASATTLLTRWAFSGAAGVTGGASTRLDAVIGEDPSGPASGATTTAWIGFWFPENATVSAVPSPSASPGEVTLKVLATSAGPLLRYELPVATLATLDLFDVQGRRVTRLASGPESAGVHDRALTREDAAGSQLASGIYFASLTAGSTRHVVRVVIAH